MNCDPYIDDLQAYLDGDLAPARRIEIETHLASCAGCRAMIASVADMDGLLRTYENRPPQLLTGREILERAQPAGSILSRIRAMLPRPMAWQSIAAVAAAIVVTLTTVLVVVRVRETRPSPATAGTNTSTPPGDGATNESPTVAQQPPDNANRPTSRGPDRAGTELPHQQERPDGRIGDIRSTPEDREHPPRSASTPRAAVDALVRAAAAGDSRALARVFAEPLGGAYDRLADAGDELRRSRQRLGAALDAKFGPGRTVIPGGDLATTATVPLAGARVLDETPRAEGTVELTVELRGGAAGAGRTEKIVAVPSGAQWKLLPENAAPQSREVRERAARAETLAAAFDVIAERVAAGQYASRDDAGRDATAAVERGTAPGEGRP